MKSKKQVILFSIILAGGSWFADSFVDYLLYYDQSYLSITFLNVPGSEIFMRLTNAGIILLLGLYIARQIGIKNTNLKRLAHVNAVLAAIRNINQLIVRLHSRDEIIQGACNELTKSREYHTSWICLVDKSGKPVVQAESGFGDKFEAIKESLEKGRLPDCIRQTLESDTPGVIRMHGSTCENCLGNALCRDRGILSVALKSRKGILGALVVSGAPEYIDDIQEQSLLKEIADDISLALANLDHQKARDEYVRELAVSEKWLSTTLRSIGDAVICTDVDGQATFGPQ